MILNSVHRKRPTKVWNLLPMLRQRLHKKTVPPKMWPQCWFQQRDQCENGDTLYSLNRVLQGSFAILIILEGEQHVLDSTVCIIYYRSQCFMCVHNGRPLKRETPLFKIILGIICYYEKNEHKSLPAKKERAMEEFLNNN